MTIECVGRWHFPMTIMLKKMEECIDEDRRMTCEEFASAVSVRQTSVHRILTGRLGIRKISAK